MNVPLVHTHVLLMLPARTPLVRTLATVTTDGLAMDTNVLKTILMSVQLVNIIVMLMLNAWIRTGASSVAVIVVIVVMVSLAPPTTTHLHQHQQRLPIHALQVLVLLMQAVMEVAPMLGSLVRATRDTLVMEWAQWVATMTMSVSVAIITVPLLKPVST